MLIALLAAAQLLVPAPVTPREPVAFVREALAAHRVVFLGDIHPLAEPKQILLAVLQQRDAAHPVDVLALEVGNELQPIIDEYLASEPENPGLLRQHDRTLRAHWGASAEYLAIYRAVYRLNREPGARPIRIVAADARGWPIAPLSSMMAAGGAVQREENMARAFGKLIRSLAPSARILVFMGGYHGLKTSGADIEVGTARAELEHWFAGLLAAEGIPMYTILSDARQDDASTATRLFVPLSRLQPDGNFIILLDADTDDVREPLTDIREDGYALRFRPARFPIRSAADAMLVLNRTTPITRLAAQP